MNRSKTLVAMVASAAITLSLVTTAFAAPATNSNCPTRNLLSQYLGTNGVNMPTSGTNLQSVFDQLKKTGAVPSSATCPKSQAALQQLFDKLGIKQPSTGTSTPAPAATPKATASTTPAPAATTPKPTVSATPTAKPAPTPVSGNMSADESHMIDLVNQDRANNGLKPLTFDNSLRAGALAHSQDMAQHNYFSHTSPTQGDFSTRVKAAGIKYSSAGENIAKYPGVDQAEVGFMNSPGHRANILGDYTRVGIGIVKTNGTYYITQWFAK